uniref:Uncharacterized protein n=1 Tax=Rhizophora mucronata TaxID=61149 RepID=A0A2P2QYU2_RHIMU
MFLLIKSFMQVLRHESY